jgi:hypothetical protein
MADIVRSMVALVAIILVLFGIGKLFSSDPGDPVKPVDYAQVTEQARPAAAYPLYAPASLPDGWRATSARFNTSAWHLGFLTDDSKYIGVEQVDVSVDRAVDTYAPDSRIDGDVTVAGNQWALRKGPDNNLTYVRRDADSTLLVTGSAPRTVIEAFIESLTTGDLDKP